MRGDADTPPQGTIRDWLDYRAAAPDGQIAYLFFDDQAPLSWRALRERARALARQFTACGIARGESVAIMMPNGRDAIHSLFGAFYGGFRATAINLAAGDDAIGFALEHSEARFALVGAGQQALFDRVRPARLAVLPQTQPGHTVDLHRLRPEDDALLMYTSGTTGRPKGVVHGHSSLLAGGWVATLAHALSKQDRGLCVLPVYHINGLCVTVMGALISGGSLAVAEKFSVRRFWDQCETARVTWFSVVPTIISHLLHAQNMPAPQTTARIRFGRSASAPLAPDVQNAFEARFSVPIIETMGLTETAAQILSNPLPPGRRKIGSPGRPYGNEARILSPDLTPLPQNQQGEIAVRGPNVMREYLKNPDATRAVFTADGWLRTGDLGHVDEDGYFFVTGRLKELIIKGGENIAPREIDDALYSHADVIEAAAFARPCPIYGERVEAAVTVSDGSAVSAEDLVEICKQKLGEFKAPDRIHILDALPKGPSGKIQRLKLAALIP